MSIVAEISPIIQSLGGNREEERLPATFFDPLRWFLREENSVIENEDGWLVPQQKRNKNKKASATSERVRA